MWLLVGVLVVVLIIGYNIGFSFRDWQYKKWLRNSTVICPKCKSNDIVQKKYLKTQLIKVHWCFCKDCGYKWEWHLILDSLEIDFDIDESAPLASPRTVELGPGNFII